MSYIKAEIVSFNAEELSKIIEANASSTNCGTCVCHQACHYTCPSDYP